jgi:hypothetical protein
MWEGEVVSGDERGRNGEKGWEREKEVRDCRGQEERSERK